MFLKSAIVTTLGALMLSVSACADPVSGTISIEGNSSYTSSSITFSGAGSVGGTSLGTLSPFADCYGCVALTSFDFGAGFTPVQVYTVTEGALTSSLLLTSITSSTDAAGLDVIGQGILSETGYSSSTGTFTLTTQAAGTGDVVTFSASTVASPVPEPGTAVLLGSGLLAGAEMVRRKRNPLVP